MHETTIKLLIRCKSMIRARLVSFKTLDKGSFEILGPSGIASTALHLTQYFSRVQSGMIYHYAVVMLIGLIALITIGSFWDILQVVLDTRLYFIYILSFLIYNYNITRIS